MSKAAKQKYYVVWYGHEPGIYTSWKECQKQIDGYSKPIYKSFTTLKEAENAYTSSPHSYIGNKQKKTENLLDLFEKPIQESICVDGACSGNPGKSEYRGVDTGTGAEIFRQGPFAEGTNNIMEYLAIVHALAFCKQRNLNLPIYSDSANAISWVRQKTAKTKLIPNNKNKALFNLIERANKWLHTNTYPNKILKWETKTWGENPADFGRK